MLTSDPISPTEVVTAALSNSTFSGLGRINQVGALGKIGYNAGGAMNQYRLTWMAEGKEVEQDELGLNALVGLATGNWGGNENSVNLTKEGLRIITGQIPWAEIAKSKLGENDSNSKK